MTSNNDAVEFLRDALNEIQRLREQAVQNVAANHEALLELWYRINQKGFQHETLSDAEFLLLTQPLQIWGLELYERRGEDVIRKLTAG